MLMKKMGEWCLVGINVAVHCIEPFVSALICLLLSSSPLKVRNTQSSGE